MLSTPNNLHSSRWPRRARPHTSHDPSSHHDDHDRSPSTMPSSTKASNGNSHFPQKLKNFFRISSFNNEKGLSSSSPDDHHHGSNGSLGHASSNNTSASAKFRQSKFFTTVGRLRSTTTASDGHPLDEALSPTAHANPYFAHQGPPALRHHNEGSVPPSPPDTPELRIDGPHGAGSPAEQPTAATKEELARKLRRVASAPNAQGMFSNGASGERPATAELGKEPIMVNKNASTLGLVETKDHDEHGLSLSVPDGDGLSPLPAPGRTPLAFRRTYSSNSIKVRNVEVGPSSFDKIKLIGKGDVGKVYLVKEKKSSRLYAMKGSFFSNRPSFVEFLKSWHWLTRTLQC